MTGHSDRVRVHVAAAAPRRSPVLHGLLSAGERRRLHAISTVDRTESSLTAHALARLMIHEFFNVPIATIEADYPMDEGTKRQCEKPRFRIPGSPCLDVSIAHAPGRVVVAISQGAGVGVDIEGTRQTLTSGWERVALSPDELERVGGLQEPARTQLVLAIWTQKEAIVKCVGAGFGSLLPSMSVEELRVRAANLHAEKTASPRSQQVSVRELQLDNGYLSSLATISKRPPLITHVDGNRCLAT